MKSLTAIIIVKNNPSHLFETLDSIKDIVSEIIIGNIDIGNDYRKKLSQNKKVKIIDLPSDVPFADMVKEDLKKQAKSDSILYLDPDELFPTINNQQLTILLNEYDYFYFPRKNIIFGKWIEHSRWWPDYQLRLFKKDSVVWPKEIHPIPKTRGKEYKFEANDENAILHYNYDNIDQYLEKAIRYAKSEAKTRNSYSLAEAIKDSTQEFISRYFAHDGYKDGMHGLVLSLLQMFYYFLVYSYYWEKKKYAEIEKNPVKEFGNFSRELNFETNFWLQEKNLVSGNKKLKLKVQNKILKVFK